jgi:hypothetical protein
LLKMDGAGKIWIENEVGGMDIEEWVSGADN